MNTLNECFDLVQVISLPDRHDRRRETTRQLEAMGIPLQPGRVEFFDAIRPAEAAAFPSIGVRGCFLSHLAVLEEARRRGVTRLLVLEDDLEVSASDRERLEMLLPAVKSATWDFLYLGHRLPVTGEPVLERVRSSDGIVTAHMYAVDQRTFTPLIDYLTACLSRPAGDPVGGPMHVDGAFSMFRAANPTVVTLVASPSVGGQRSSRSDIHTSRIDRVPGLREAAGLARRLRRGLRGGVAA